MDFYQFLKIIQIDQFKYIRNTYYKKILDVSNI